MNLQRLKNLSEKCDKYSINGTLENFVPVLVDEGNDCVGTEPIKR